MKFWQQTDAAKIQFEMCFMYKGFFLPLVTKSNSAYNSDFSCLTALLQVRNCYICWRAKKDINFLPVFWTFTLNRKLKCGWESLWFCEINLLLIFIQAFSFLHPICFTSLTDTRNEQVFLVAANGKEYCILNTDLEFASHWNKEWLFANADFYGIIGITRKNDRNREFCKYVHLYMYLSKTTTVSISTDHLL